MQALYLLAIAGTLSRFSVNGRILDYMNISNMWLLPKEGFPYFYRHFNDKVSWGEALTICGFYRAELLSVQTTEEMDGIKLYLNEMDVVDNVWIGLQRTFPEESFFWTNGEKFMDEGYWLEPIPKWSRSLCAAMDPAQDFRWRTYRCKGPQVNSFVCQYLVPQWAKECLTKSLPSFTVTLLPDEGVIQMTSDCGLDGTRTMACDDKADREEILKRLSCKVDAFATTIGKPTTANALREINTQPKWSSTKKQIKRHRTPKPYHSFTRHRRSLPTTTLNLPSQHQTTPPTNKQPSSPIPLPNLPSHVFPHSPYLASERNAPSTNKPHPKETTPFPPFTHNDTTPLYHPRTGIIPEHHLNHSLSPATSENPPILLIIDDKHLDGPFLSPHAKDTTFSNPPLSPGDATNIDLIQMNNCTANPTNTDQITSSDASGPTPQKTAEEETTQLPNTLEGEGKEEDVPQRPNRGRLFPHTSQQASFYPRFLNRVLG